MSTKIVIKETGESIELIRGAQVPREGEILFLTRKGEKEERLYTIYSVEHVFDFNSRMPIGTTTITVVEQNSNNVPDAVSPDFDGGQ